MAAQRIVLTSPWRLGLFVFVLVVGTGFGLIYTYMELFGGKIDLEDPQTVQYAYMVLGGVAVLGLMGYISVITSARPIDRVVRGSKVREQTIKRLGKISDPRDADLDDFESEPAIAKVVERWAHDVEVANAAQLQSASQAEAVSLLVKGMKESGELTLDPENERPEMVALIDAINDHVVAAVENATSDAPPAPVPVEPAPAAMPDGVKAAVRDLGDAESELSGFVASVAQQASQVAQSAQTLASNDASGVVSADMVGMVDAAKQNLQRIADLRETLDGLAEESNKLAIAMALQISRLGDEAGGLLDTAEDVRSLSTRYQRLSGDLRLCENDQASTLSRLQQIGSGGPSVGAGASQALVQESMVLDQNAEALREVLGRLHDPLAQLRALAGLPPVESAEPAATSGPAPVASAPVSPVASAPVAPVAEPDPVHDEPAAPAERIYEMAELGGREVEESSSNERIRDLQDFGAIEL